MGKNIAETRRKSALSKIGTGKMSGKGVLRLVSGDLLGFWCPGCQEMHAINVDPDFRPCWGFNGDYQRPTFSPSILVTGKRKLTEDEYQRVRRGERVDLPDRCCHTFVTDGRVQFLDDCTHELAGQVIDLAPMGDDGAA